MTVFATQEIDPAGLDLLKGFPIRQHAGPAPISRPALLASLQDVSALISMPTDRIDAEVLDAGPLKIVAQHAVGYDNIDLQAAAERGILVTNTPGVLTDATADLAFALILATTRRLVEGDRLVRRGDFAGWRPTLLRGLCLQGATLGIVGLGRIGRATAARARAFGMRVIHHGRTSGMPLPELLAESDVVSLHVPLSDTTHHLIDAEALGFMKPTSVLVNTSRGPVVDEDALVRALAERRIAAAGLDVFEEEPRVHPGLLPLDNVVLLPHLGSATWTARRAMAVKAAENVVAVLGGRAPLTPVSR